MPRGAWSLEMLFNGPEQRAQIEEPPPLTLMERQKLKLIHFRGWWQGDWISPVD